MDEGSFHDPLLSNVDDARSSPVEKKRPLLLLTLKWIFKIAMWAIFVAWAAFLFLYPAHFVKSFFQKWIVASEGTVFGITGSVFLLFSGPILLIAVLAILYLIVFDEGELHVPQKKTRKSLRFRLWTFPALVDGPFGVVSAAEFIGILMFIAFVVWSVAYYTVSNLNLLSEIPLSPKWRSSVMLELTGLRFGLIGLFCLAFLFLPIARGSVLLRFIEIPFEQATRYHVWLGHLTMAIFTLHGLFYIIGWAMQGRLIHEILEWRNIGVANLAGVISLIAGLFMWVTSLPPVRKQNFELFFYTHQLYMVFVLFLALHVGDFIFSMAAGGIFLFMLDRFLRFCQSRRIVDVVSATCFPCGTMEVVLAKPKSLHYNALSFIFLQFRELSWLQWHPFSVSSSPLDGDRHLSVLIKVLGGWTSKLRRQICLDGAAAQFGLPFQPHSKITASVEGPYGHEVPYHLTYENLILVAGGIGISPFLAILRDIFHLIQGGKSCLPKNILIIWAVKTSNELSLLSVREMESICPFHTDKLNLEIQMFVTREVEPPLEEGKKPKGTNPFVIPVSSGHGMSGLVGTGDRVWSGLYVASSIAGFIILMALVDIYYINPYKVSYWWYKGLLFVLCMIASVAIFGGLVVVFWKLWEGRVSTLAGENPSDDDLKLFKSVPHAEPLAPDNLWLENFATSSSLTYGRRPDFKGIFDMISDRWGKVDIGVIVCGPPTLQTSIAKECRSHGLNRTSYSPIFHFYSHTFDL